MENKLLESLDIKTKDKKVAFRRYALSEIISESYKTFYGCEKDSNLQKLAEAHIADVRSNPADIDRLSRQLCKLKHLQSMVESKELEDEGLLVPEESYDTVEPKEEIKEAIEETPEEEIEESQILEEETELTDEEVQELAKHLEEIRKNKKDLKEGNPVSDSLPAAIDNFLQDLAQMYGDINYSDIMKKEFSPEDIAELKKLFDKYVEEAEYADEEEIGDISKEVAKIVKESKSWDDISLVEFNKKSAGKAFVKTFKKLDSKLHEGTALTRQESIALYKAANSAMTHLSVELEHNPEFLDTFKESVTLLSADVASLLESMKNDKAPSKATMKSLAKFSEAILREEDEEELPPIEDEENEFVGDEEELSIETGESASEEEEQFDQEYADARVEIHKELADEYADEENPEVQEKLAQDAEEIAELPGVTEEQLAAIEEIPAVEETPEVDDLVDEPVEEPTEESDEDDLVLDNTDITEDELAELKKHLTEMRREKKLKESGGRRLMRRSK